MCVHIFTKFYLHTLPVYLAQTFFLSIELKVDSSTNNNANLLLENSSSPRIFLLSNTCEFSLPPVFCPAK
ncbi:hypothetical protein Pelo_16546 [Pelomyxa schiedti]|nr:hypothetical protein Pelo_16546 [Pelomyxa schiedti]